MRQIPVVLGRRKRAVEEKPLVNEAMTSGDPNTTEVPETTTQIFELTVNGQHERFIIAQEVNVDVYPQTDPLEDDYSDTIHPVSANNNHVS